MTALNATTTASHRDDLILAHFPMVRQVAYRMVSRFPSCVEADDLVTIGFPPENTIKFDYAITMAVRYGEKDWKNKIEETVQRNLPGIQAILTSYGVPLIDEAQASQTAADR